MGNCNAHQRENQRQTFASWVTQLLTIPEYRTLCPSRFAVHIVQIIEEFTGDHFLNAAKAFHWESIEVCDDQAFTSRRSRIVDRLVQYATERKFTNTEVYTSFFMICPKIDKIIQFQKRRSWEPHNDWMIYDLVAKVALACAKKEISEDILKEVHSDIENNFVDRHIKTIWNFMQNLAKSLYEAREIIDNFTFGDAISQVVDYFCDVATHGEEGIPKSDVHLLKCVSHLILHFELMHPRLWYQDPMILVAGAVNSAITFTGLGTWGSWYSVQHRTCIREGVLFDSPTKILLNPGDRVHVTQKFGRRLFVDAPVVGFASKNDGAGLDILVESSDEDFLANLTGFKHDDLQSPFRDMTRWIFTDRTTGYVGLKTRFAEEDNAKVSTMRFSQGQLVIHPMDVDE